MDLFLVMQVNMKICVMCGMQYMYQRDSATYSLFILHREYLLKLP